MIRREASSRPGASPSVLVLLPLLLAGASVASSAEPASPQPPAAARTRAGVVTASRLNVRRGPGTEHARIGALTKGAEVSVRRVDGDWCEIDYPSSLTVWLDARSVEIEGEPGRATAEAPLKGAVTAPSAELRSSPGRGAVVGELKKGDEVAVIGAFRGWCHIEPPADLVAYVSRQHLDIAEEPAPDETPAVGPAEVPALMPVGGGPAAAPGSNAGRTALPERLAHVEKIIEISERALLEADSAAAAEEALGLLREALAAEGVTSADRPLVRARVREAIAAASPGRWLKLLESARAEGGARVRAVADRYDEELRKARALLDAARPLEFTATGTLMAPVIGSDRHRLALDGTVVCDLASGEADLAPLVGRRVGVLGERVPPARPGELPLIRVRYVQEIAGEPAGR